MASVVPCGWGAVWGCGAVVCWRAVSDPACCMHLVLDEGVREVLLEVSDLEKGCAGGAGCVESIAHDAPPSRSAATRSRW